jgi:hypothetical protein
MLLLDFHSTVSYNFLQQNLQDVVDDVMGDPPTALQHNGQALSVVVELTLLYHFWNG